MIAFDFDLAFCHMELFFLHDLLERIPFSIFLNQSINLFVKSSFQYSQILQTNIIYNNRKNLSTSRFLMFSTEIQTDQDNMKQTNSGLPDISGRINKVNKSIMDMGLKKNEQDMSNMIRLKYRDSLTSNEQRSKFIQTDRSFVEQIQKITKKRESVLMSLLNNKKRRVLTDQQCDQIDYMARIHYKANIVNKNTDNKWDSVQEKFRCYCGCQRAKGQSLSLLANIKEMSILGSGVVLLFIFKKTFSYILLSTVLIYAIFAIATNLMGDSSVKVKQCEDVYCQYRTKASSQNKYEPQIFGQIQWWLGVGFCFVWIFILRLIKYFGKTQNKNIDAYLNSSSDYAILIQNLPYGQYEENDLIAYFDLLYEKALKMKLLTQTNQEDQQKSENNIGKLVSPEFSQKQTNKFNMKNIQVIYNMEFSRVTVEKIIALALQIKDLYKTNKNTHQTEIINYNVQAYKQLKNQICQTFQMLTDLRKKFFYDDNFRRSISTTVAIVQFEKPKDKDIFLRYFGNEKVGILKQFQQKVKSFFQKASRTVMFRGKILKILRAPQPSDLLYTNCEKKFSVSRILLIYIITFFIILLSFGLITILIYFQEKFSKIEKQIQTQQTQTGTITSEITDGYDDTTITILNIVIALGLQVVNKFLWFSLYYLLDIEYNHTMTQKIISQMNKVLFATCINIIALPIITNYTLRNNVYGSKGLTGMVFDYQISILGVGLVMKLIDPPNFVKRILLNIRRIRNVIIRFLCKNLIIINPQKGVHQINTLYEGNYFDIAESYLYIMAATYQAAFFCQLQPSLLILVTLVVIFFYWVNKFKVLRTCKIPQITEMLVFETALSQAAFIPIVYGAGTIVISYIENHYNPNLPVNYIPAFVSIGIGVFGFTNPGDCLNKVVNFMMNKISNQIKNSDNVSEEASAQGIIEKSDQHSVQDNIAQQQPEIMNRLDNYFRNSNTLPLIGFQHILLGGQYNKFPLTSLEQLESFCGKFMENEGQIKKVGKKINQTIVTKVLGIKNPKLIPRMSISQQIDFQKMSVQKGANQRSSIQVANMQRSSMNKNIAFLRSQNKLPPLNRKPQNVELKKIESNYAEDES